MFVMKLKEHENMMWDSYVDYEIHGSSGATSSVASRLAIAAASLARQCSGSAASSQSRMSVTRCPFYQSFRCFYIREATDSSIRFDTDCSDRFLMDFLSSC